MSKHLAFALIMAASSGACGRDAISYSEPVSINLKAKSADVINATVSNEKGITSEASNPYGRFVANARAALDGADPGEIALDSVTLLLGARSTGVTALGEIFDGAVVVQFVVNDTNNTLPAAHRTITAADGVGPLALTIDFDSAGIATGDYAKLLSGGFKVAARGPAAPLFQTKGADADLQLTFSFTAYE
jgi:hypothetical protein